MKKLSLLFAFLLVAFMTKAQNQDDYQDYNHWSAEVQVGLTKPASPLASGYHSNVDFFQGDLGVRYMINEYFGLKGTVGYNKFEDAGSSANFESNLLRGDLQGVVNVGSLLGFRDWTNTFNVLVHGGAGYAQLKGKKPVKTETDKMGYLTVGVTPQLRLSNHFALTGDASFFGNFRQDRTFDGTGYTNRRGFNGYYLNASIGLTYYFGGKGSVDKVHADWYNKAGNQFGELSNRLDNLENELAGVKSDVNDHYNEFQNHIKDSNNNGIPDYMEDALDSRYKQETPEKVDAMRELINGYASVYFPFASSKPHDYSNNAVNYVIDFMKKNPSVSVTLKGYADEIGNSSYNQTLSAKRADRVKDLMVASGIDAGRISTEGMGEDTSADKASSQARQLVRRVIFELR